MFGLQAAATFQIGSEFDVWGILQVIPVFRNTSLLLPERSAAFVGNLRNMLRHKDPHLHP